MHFSDYGHTPERRKQNTYGGVGYYRIAKPAENIKGHEVTIVGKEILDFGKTLAEQWDNIFKEYDVFWTNYFSNAEAGAACFYYARHYGKKVVVDADDNYLDVPESNKLYDQFKSGKKDRAILSAILSFADAVTVSTKPLQEKVKEHIKSRHGIDKPVFVLPNMNDVRDWDYVRQEPDPKKITIGYVGSNSHFDDLMMFLPQLAEVMNNDERVHFETIGAIEKKLIPQYFKGFTQSALDRCAVLPATPTFREFPGWLAEQGWDFAVAPLVDTPFTRSKSHIKWLEYSMYKIPCLASRVYPYFMDIGKRKTIQDGKTGVLVKENGWTKAIKDFIDRPEYRNKIGEQAHEAVKGDWQYDAKLITDITDEILALPKVSIEIPK